MSHFKESEFIESKTAQEYDIDNGIPAELMDALAFTMAGMERVRASLGHPILVSSGYRCPALNELVGGSENSQHMKAEACDFTCPAFGPPKAICERLEPLMGILGIDQMIQEGTWVHLSFTHHPRHVVLTRSGPGKYTPGLA